MFHFTEEQIRERIVEPIRNKCSNKDAEAIELSIDDYEDGLPIYLLEMKESFLVLFQLDKVDIEIQNEIIWIYNDPETPYPERDTDYVTVYNGRISEHSMDSLFEMVKDILLAGLNYRIVFRTATMLEEHAVPIWTNMEEFNTHNLYQNDLYIMKDTDERYDLQYGNIHLHVNSKEAPTCCHIIVRYPSEHENEAEYKACSRRLLGNYGIPQFDPEEFRRGLYAFAETGEYQKEKTRYDEIGMSRGNRIQSFIMKTDEYARSGVDIIEVMVPEQGSGKLLMEITMFIDEKKRFVYRNEVTVEEAYRIFERYYRWGEVPDLAKWTKVSEIPERDQYDHRKIVQW